VNREQVTIYVEGGGDATSLRSECREGFSKFFEAAGLKGQMPRVVACGTRNAAFDDFSTAVKTGKKAFLLVDSEAAVEDQWETGDRSQWKPWDHLWQRDGWEKPGNADDLACHLMVQCMEAWFLADRETLRNFFDQDFRERALPDKANGIETLSKDKLFGAIKQATRDCKKGPYGKGAHSFKLLKQIDPAKVTADSPWAKRLIETVKK